jgi:hypothetical protein
MQTAVVNVPPGKKTGAFLIGFILWLSVAASGVVALSLYSNAPEKQGTPPDQWPTSSSLSRVPRSSTLVMFVHPKCPCSRASISELAALLAHSSGDLRADVVFLHPPGKDDSWIQTDLWRDALKLPETAVLGDLSGRETNLFHPAVSGETLVYDAEGKLIFHGGITSARGHVGDNPGRSALQSYLSAGVAPLSRTPVFGCRLFGKPAIQSP